MEDKIKKRYYLLASGLFAVLFTVVFIFGKGYFVEEYNAANSESATINLYSSSQEKIADGFSSYGMLVGVLIAFITLGIMKLANMLLGKLSEKLITKQVISIASISLMLIFWGNIALFEPRNTVLANGIIFFIAYPLFYGALATIVLLIAHAIYPKVMTKRSTHEKSN